MRVFLLLMLGFGLLQGRSLEELKVELERVIKEGDAGGYWGLYFQEGMGQEQKDFILQMFEHRGKGIRGEELPFRGIEEAELDKFEVDVQVGSGVMYEPNLKKLGRLEMRFGEDGKRVTSLNYGRDGDDYFLVGAKVTQLDWEGPKDGMLWYWLRPSDEAAAEGKVLDEDDVEVRVVWNASGVELDQRKGETSFSFQGQHIERFELVKPEEHAGLKLEVKKDQELVFEGEFAAGEKVVYEREKE